MHYSHQILSLEGLVCNQFLHMQDRAVYRVNDAIRNEIDIVIVTDGEHRFLEFNASFFLRALIHMHLGL